MAFEQITGAARSAWYVDVSLLLRLHPQKKGGKRSFSGRLCSDAVKAMRLIAGDRVRVECDPGKAWRISRVPPKQSDGVVLHHPNNKGEMLAFRATITQDQAERYFGRSVRLMCEPEAYESASAVVFLVADSE